MRTCRRTLPILLLASAAALSSPAPGRAGTLAGVTLPDSVQAGSESLVLNGMGLRKKLFIKVYVAGLYLRHKEGDAGRILATDAPRRMAMHFLYGVSPSQMCDAWKEGLEANTPNASAEVKKGFATLCSWMEEIPKGHALVLTYLPGSGTQVEVNGKAKGTLEGKPTADAVLATWIGKDPAPGPDFKAGVLGH
jgi:Chalcone isomerase-like